MGPNESRCQCKWNPNNVPSNIARAAGGLQNVTNVFAEMWIEQTKERPQSNSSQFLWPPSLPQSAVFQTGSLSTAWYRGQVFSETRGQQLGPSWRGQLKGVHFFVGKRERAHMKLVRKCRAFQIIAGASNKVRFQISLFSYFSLSSELARWWILPELYKYHLPENHKFTR